MKTFSFKNFHSVPFRNDLKHLVNSVRIIYLQERVIYLVKKRLNISFVESNKVTYLVEENYHNLKDLKQIITKMIEREIVQNIYLFIISLSLKKKN